MTARVVSLLDERQRRERTCEYSAPEGAQVNHFAHLQRQFEASVCAQQSAGEITVLDAQLRRNLSQLSANTLQGVAVYMTCWAAATALAGLLLKNTADLLHRGLSLQAPSIKELGRGNFPVAVTENVSRTEARRDP